MGKTKERVVGRAVNAAYVGLVTRLSQAPLRSPTLQCRLNQQFVLYATDFEIDPHFLDLEGPGGPAKANRPSGRRGAKRPTGWKAKLPRCGRRDPHHRQK